MFKEGDVIIKFTGEEISRERRVISVHSDHCLCTPIYSTGPIHLSHEYLAQRYVLRADAIKKHGDRFI